jgi:ABC-type ATPase with predicted acetyltransferase domain
MGRLAIYTCRVCEQDFRSEERGGMIAIPLRCITCDNAASYPLKGRDALDNNNIPPKKWKDPSLEEIAKDIEKEAGRCEKCGGEFKMGLRPMCPHCKSRDAKVKKIISQWD